MAAVFGTCLDSTENLYKSPGQNRDTLYQINPVDKILIFLCWLYISEKDFNDLGEYFKTGNRKPGVCPPIYNPHYVELHSPLSVSF